MDITPLAFSLLCALLAVAYFCSCVLNLVEWLFGHAPSTPTHLTT